MDKYNSRFGVGFNLRLNQSKRQNQEKHQHKAKEKKNNPPLGMLLKNNVSHVWDKNV